MPESGVWEPAFEGQRPPFEPGNEVGVDTRFEAGNDASTKHGAGSPGKLKPAAERYLERIRVLAPTGDQRADEFAFERLAWLLAKIELAEQWIDDNGVVDARGEPQPVLAQLSTWENSARRMLVELGLTASSRAQLRLDLLKGDLLDAATVQAGFVATMGTAIDLVAAMARELLPADVQAAYVEAFRRRLPPAVSEALAAVDHRALPPGDAA